MKNFSIKRYVTLLSALILTMAGCTFPMDPPANTGDAIGSSDTGIVTITIGKADSGDAVQDTRTLHPAESAFTGYKLSFTGGPTGASHGDATITLAGSASVELAAPGTWTITATAYKGDDAVARGSAPVTIAAGDSASVNITLAPITGGAQGTFDYDIRFPASLDSAVLTIHPLPSGTDVVITATPTQRLTGIFADTGKLLDAGQYLASVKLTRGSLGAGRTEVLHIYSGLTTEAKGAAWVFTDADLKPALVGTVSTTGGSIPNPKSGETLTAVTTSLEGTTALSYQWMRGDTADGTFTNITTNGTDASYTLTAADEKKYIQVTVSRAGYSGSINSMAIYVATDLGLYIGTAASPQLNTDTLALALNWLQSNAASNTAYTILLGVDESLAAYSLDSSAVNNQSGVTITLKGKDAERTVQLSGTGSLFTVDTGVTLILDENISLKGVSGNNASLIQVNAGSTLELRDGAKISGNTKFIAATSSPSFSRGGGVYISGTFTMKGGKISGNIASASVSSTSTTTIYGCGSFGGGVYVDYSGNFTMEGGEISVNRASSSYASRPDSTSSSGGGVYSNGTFTMTGGKISGNTVTSSHASGSGVYSNGTFTMEGGEISGNSASSDNSNAYASASGGGVYSAGTFTMTGGTIYGSDGGANANKLTGGGTKRGISLYKDYGVTAKYGDGSPIIAGDQTGGLYTDDTLPSGIEIYNISLNHTGTYTFPAATVGYGTQTAKSVTIINTGNRVTGALTATLSGTNSGDFSFSPTATLSTTAISSIAAGGTRTNAFTVVPKTGLAGGTYTATVTVSGGNGITANFSVSFTVNALVNAATPSITAQPAGATYTQNATATALTVTANVSDGGTLSYQWYKNTSNSTTGGSAVGTNSTSYMPSTTTVGTTYYYVVVTNTNNSVNGTKTATTTSSVAAVTVIAPASLTINIGFNFGAITITGNDGTNTIRRTGSPTSLTLSATGYIGVQWYVDGILKSGATSNSITLSAAAYDIRNHSVTFTGVKDGVPYSQLIPFRVVQ